MKTLAIRLEDELHARLTMLAKLSGVTLTDAIRTAIDSYVAQLAANGDLSAKAEAALADIDRAASQQREAIASLFAPTSSNDAGASNPDKPATRRASRTKR